MVWFGDDRGYYYDRPGERDPYVRRAAGYHDEDGYQSRGRSRDRYARSATSNVPPYQDGADRTVGHFRSHGVRPQPPSQPSHLEPPGYGVSPVGDAFPEDSGHSSPSGRASLPGATLPSRKASTVSSTVTSPPSSLGRRGSSGSHVNKQSQRSQSQSRSRSSSRSSSGSRLGSSSSKVRSSSSDSSSRSLSPNKAQSPTHQSSGKASRGERPASAVTAPSSSPFLQSAIAAPNNHCLSSLQGNKFWKPWGEDVTGTKSCSADTSLKDGLFHEYKKHGKVTVVKVIGQGTERYAVVCFKKPEDVEKALEVSKDKLFFGCKIEVTAHEGLDGEDNEFRPLEAELDEYHPKATRTLFIGNLEKDITTSELRKHFDQFGEIIEIDIKKQGSASSYAFIQYSDIASVVKAMRKLDGENLGANRIKLGFGKSMPTMCVWLDGIVDTVSEKFLSRTFSRYGPVSFAAIDREKGHALVYFDSLECAQHAVAEMRGRVLGGKKLQVDFASRECQTSFFDKIEMSGQVVQGERPWERRDRRAEFDVIRDDRFPRGSSGCAVALVDVCMEPSLAASSPRAPFGLPRDARGVAFDGRGYGRYEVQPPPRTARGVFRGLQRGTYGSRGRGQPFPGRYDAVYHDEFADRRHRFPEKDDVLDDVVLYEDRPERLKHLDGVLVVPPEWASSRKGSLKKHRNSTSDQESHHSQSPPQSRHHSRSPPPPLLKGSKKGSSKERPPSSQHHRPSPNRTSSRVGSPSMRDAPVDPEEMALEAGLLRSVPWMAQRRPHPSPRESPSQLERKRRLLGLKDGARPEDTDTDCADGEEEGVRGDVKYPSKQVQDILSSSDGECSPDASSRKKNKAPEASPASGKARQAKDIPSVVSKRPPGNCRTGLEAKYSGEQAKPEPVPCLRRQLDPRRQLDHNKVSSTVLLRVKKVHSDKFELMCVGDARGKPCDPGLVSSTDSEVGEAPSLLHFHVKHGEECIDEVSSSSDNPQQTRPPRPRRDPSPLSLPLPKFAAALRSPKTSPPVAASPKANSQSPRENCSPLSALTNARSGGSFLEASARPAQHQPEPAAEEKAPDPLETVPEALSPSPSPKAPAKGPEIKREPPESSSDSECSLSSPNRPSFDEQIRALDEKYNALTGPTRTFAATVAVAAEAPAPPVAVIDYQKYNIKKRPRFPVLSQEFRVGFSATPAVPQGASSPSLSQASSAPSASPGQTAPSPSLQCVVPQSPVTPTTPTTPTVLELHGKQHPPVASVAAQPHNEASPRTCSVRREPSPPPVKHQVFQSPPHTPHAATPTAPAVVVVKKEPITEIPHNRKESRTKEKMELVPPKDIPLKREPQSFKKESRKEHQASSRNSCKEPIIPTEPLCNSLPVKDKRDDSAELPAPATLGAVKRRVSSVDSNESDSAKSSRSSDAYLDLPAEAGWHRSEEGGHSTEPEAKRPKLSSHHSSRDGFGKSHSSSKSNSSSKKSEKKLEKSSSSKSERTEKSHSSLSKSESGERDDPRLASMESKSCKGKDEKKAKSRDSREKSRDRPKESNKDNRQDSKHESLTCSSSGGSSSSGSGKPRKEHSSDRSDKEKCRSEKRSSGEHCRDSKSKSKSKGDGSASSAPQASDFCFLDDEPVYFSMYDKVKARSSQNQTLKDQANMETMRQKFSRLKQSRAKKGKSADQDSDRDSDLSSHHSSDSETKSRVSSHRSKQLNKKRKLVIESSSDENEQSFAMRLLHKRVESSDFCTDSDAESLKESYKCKERKVDLSDIETSDSDEPSHLLTPSQKHRSKQRHSSEKSSRSRHGKSEGESSDADVSRSSKRKEHKKKRPRKVSVLRSDLDASDDDCHPKLDDCKSSKPKPSSRLEDGKHEECHPKEPSTHSSSKSKRPSRDTDEPRPDEEGESRQRHSSKKRKKSKKSSKVKEKKSGDKPSNTSQTSTSQKRADHPWDAGALLDESSVSSKYIGSPKHLLGSPPVLQPSIMSDAEIKSELSDYDFEPSVKSRDKDMESWSCTKNKLAVDARYSPAREIKREYDEAEAIVKRESDHELDKIVNALNESAETHPAGKDFPSTDKKSTAYSMERVPYDDITCDIPAARNVSEDEDNKDSRLEEAKSKEHRKKKKEKKKRHKEEPPPCSPPREPREEPAPPYAAPAVLDEDSKLTEDIRLDEDIVEEARRLEEELLAQSEETSTFGDGDAVPRREEKPHQVERHFEEEAAKETKRLEEELFSSGRDSWHMKDEKVYDAHAKEAKVLEDVLGTSSAKEDVYTGLAATQELPSNHSGSPRYLGHEEAEHFKMDEKEQGSYELDSPRKMEDDLAVYALLQEMGNDGISAPELPKEPDYLEPMMQHHPQQEESMSFLLPDESSSSLQIDTSMPDLTQEESRESGGALEFTDALHSLQQPPQQLSRLADKPGEEPAGSPTRPESEAEECTKEVPSEPPLLQEAKDIEASAEPPKELPDLTRDVVQPEVQTTSAEESEPPAATTKLERHKLKKRRRRRSEDMDQRLLSDTDEEHRLEIADRGLEEPFEPLYVQSYLSTKEEPRNETSPCTALTIPEASEETEPKVGSPARAPLDSSAEEPLTQDEKSVEPLSPPHIRQEEACDAASKEDATTDVRTAPMDKRESEPDKKEKPDESTQEAVPADIPMENDSSKDQDMFDDMSHSTPILEIIETLSSPVGTGDHREGDADDSTHQENDSSGEQRENPPSAEDEAAPPHPEPSTAESEGARRKPGTRKGRKTKVRRASAPRLEASEAPKVPARRGRATSADKVRRSLRSDNHENASSENEDAAAFLSNETKSDAPTLEAEACPVGKEVQPREEERLSLDGTSKDSAEVADVSGDAPPLEERPGDADAHKDEPRKRRGRKKKSSGEHHAFSPPPPAEKPLEATKPEEPDHKEAEKQKEVRPLFVCGRQAPPAEHKAPKGNGSSSAYDVYEFKDSEDEEEAPFGGTDWQTAPEKQPDKPPPEAVPPRPQEPPLELPLAAKPHEHEKRHEEAKGHKAHEEAAPTREYVTELSQHGKISITIRLHQKDGHDGSSSSTAEVVKTSEAVAGEDLKAEHGRQAPPAKQEASDAHQMKTRKSARLMSQANKTTIDEVIEDVVKGNFRPSEDESDQQPEGPITRAARRTRSSRRNEDSKGDEADKNKPEAPVLVIADNKVKESPEEAKPAATVTTAAPESQCSDAEQNNKSESKMRASTPAAQPTPAASATVPVLKVELFKTRAKEEQKATCEDDSDSRLSPTELIDPVTGFLTPVNKKGEPTALPEGEAAAAAPKPTKPQVPVEPAENPAVVVPNAKEAAVPTWTPAAMPAAAVATKVPEAEQPEAKPVPEQIQRPPVLAHAGNPKNHTVLQGATGHHRLIVNSQPETHKVVSVNVKTESSVVKVPELNVVPQGLNGGAVKPAEHPMPTNVPPPASPSIPQQFGGPKGVLAPVGQPPVSLGQPPVSLGQSMGAWVGARPLGPQYPLPFTTLAGQQPQHMPRPISCSSGVAHPSVVRSTALPQPQALPQPEGPKLAGTAGHPPGMVMGMPPQMLCGQGKMEHAAAAMSHAKVAEAFALPPQGVSRTSPASARPQPGHPQGASTMAQAPGKMHEQRGPGPKGAALQHPSKQGFLQPPFGSYEAAGMPGSSHTPTGASQGVGAAPGGVIAELLQNPHLLQQQKNYLAMAASQYIGVGRPGVHVGTPTPPHTPTPPQDLLHLRSPPGQPLLRYPVMWQGLLALKNDQAAVQMHFVSGNSRIAVASLPPMTDGCTPPVRIAQRMRLEQTQLEGVARKMQMVEEHCILLALPCGRDHMDVLQQSNNLRNGFINYLQLKQAAGIVNAAAPGSQQPAYVIHIFPSCEFSNENLARIAPDLLHSVSDIAHLLVIIATV
ncbi:RNA recognition motif protein, putative [Ixodes scapularis]|uniref:Msx2-interacting protein n=1 Tax=Ixodes scapularis TaxID=6945 RepID=B7Q3Y1_IXOSC|nr:RNA recognition motif protein, putative [Ixodes scapularis]|eukprot:XP_002411413.1 RNA recognition motif protein, putative [Ixodes scapularis]